MKLVIIGNGFDLNHNCKTGYDNFREYLKRRSYTIGDFNLLNYFIGLSDNFWSDFENQLGNIEFESDMKYYVRDCTPTLPDNEYEHNMSINSGFQESFYEALENFLPCLCQALSDFVCDATNKKIDKKDYFESCFEDKDIFISFNYTKLLENVYHINDNQILHIHGIAYKQEHYMDDVDIEYSEPTIVFGHDKTTFTTTSKKTYEYNPENPTKCLAALRQELKKQYNFKGLNDFLIKQTKTIDVVEIIGHNLGNVDKPYFSLLNKLIPITSKIIYWVYDENEEDEKLNILHQFFPGHKIDKKYYL